MFKIIGLILYDLSHQRLSFTSSSLSLVDSARAGSSQLVPLVDSTRAGPFIRSNQGLST